MGTCCDTYSAWSRTVSVFKGWLDSDPLIPFGSTSLARTFLAGFSSVRRADNGQMQDESRLEGAMHADDGGLQPP